MKKSLFIGFMLAVSVAQSAQFEASDLIGRLMVSDQSAGSVQGILEVRRTTSNDPVIGNIVAKARLSFKGTALQLNCAGHFVHQAQQLELICENSKVLALKLSPTNENVVNYLQGSFMSGEFTLVNRPLTDKSEKITVDIKNLDLR